MNNFVFLSTVKIRKIEKMKYKKANPSPRWRLMWLQFNKFHEKFASGVVPTFKHTHHFPLKLLKIMFYNILKSENFNLIRKFYHIIIISNIPSQWKLTTDYDANVTKIVILALPLQNLKTFSEFVLLFFLFVRLFSWIISATFFPFLLIFHSFNCFHSFPNAIKRR